MQDYTLVSGTIFQQHVSKLYMVKRSVTQQS